MNIINLLRTINKLKAGLSVVIGNDKRLIAKAYDMSIHHSTLFSDSEDERRENYGNIFNEFLCNEMNKADLKT